MGTEKVAFPGDSRWCSENKSIFCNMVASARPEERFAAGPVPAWLGAPKMDEAFPRPGVRALQSSCTRAHGEGKNQLFCGNAPPCPAENGRQKASFSRPGLACCVLMVFTCRLNITACLIHCCLSRERACAYVLFGIMKTL